MKSIRTTRTIAAPLELVFQTVADVRNFKHAITHITEIEFLSDQQVGTGTKFRETRVHNGREQTVELEVQEFVDNEKVRIVSDAGGTIWDTVFAVEAAASSASETILTMEMAIKPHTLMARITTPLIRGFVAKAVESDLDAVKTYCESELKRAQ